MTSFNLLHQKKKSIEKKFVYLPVNCLYLIHETLDLVYHVHPVVIVHVYNEKNKL